MSNLKENGIIINEKINKAMKDTIEKYSWHGAPDTAILMLCQECNLRCKYCYAGKGEYLNPGLMSEETGRKAIDFIANLDNNSEQFNLILFGGEPLMDFEKVKNLVAYAKQVAKECNKTVSFSITTNGTLVNLNSPPYLVTTFSPLNRLLCRS
ncbi:MAG: 4Fe-4S cluster-binding domain-containing protein [Lachnospiraceae bacterium]|nr:4Fe-4S cluster-binding domain-containing protein [Lachnospiraceae bacterium]